MVISAAVVSILVAAVAAAFGASEYVTGWAFLLFWALAFIAFYQQLKEVDS
jgi:hypothetical protein